MVELINVFPNLLNVLFDMGLGGLGGLCAYLYDYNKASRGEKEFIFRMSSLMVNVVLGVFVSYAMSGLIDTEAVYRNAVLLMSGFSAYSILTIAESKFAETIYDRFIGRSNSKQEDKYTNVAEDKKE